MYSNANAAELINTIIQTGSQAPIRTAIMTPTIKATTPQIHFALLGKFVIIACLAEMRALQRPHLPLRTAKVAAVDFQHF
jgi:hypothetical protein